MAIDTRYNACNLTFGNAGKLSKYRHALQQRTKFIDPQIEIKLNTYDADGNTRFVTVQTKNGLFERSIVKLCPLPKEGRKMYISRILFFYFFVVW